MPADQAQTMRQGDQEVLYASVSAPVGDTVEISGTPTVTLWQQVGSALVIVTGYDAINVTGSTGGAVVSAMAWYDLASSALSPGLYRLVFDMVYTGSDGMQRTRTWEIAITLNANP